MDVFALVIALGSVTGGSSASNTWIYNKIVDYTSVRAVLTMGSIVSLVAGYTGTACPIFSFYSFIITLLLVYDVLVLFPIMCCYDLFHGNEEKRVLFSLVMGFLAAPGAVGHACVSTLLGMQIFAHNMACNQMFWILFMVFYLGWNLVVTFIIFVTSVCMLWSFCRHGQQRPNDDDVEGGPDSPPRPNDSAYIRTVRLKTSETRRASNSNKQQLQETTSTSSNDSTESTDSAGEECCICLCSFKERQRVSTLGCLHKYHEGCINQWLTQNNTCPQCKQKIRDAKPLCSGGSGTRESVVIFTPISRPPRAF